MNHTLSFLLASLVLTSGASAQAPCPTWQSLGSYGADNDDWIAGYAADRLTGDWFVGLECSSCNWNGSSSVPWVLRGGQTVIDPNDFFTGSLNGLHWIDDAFGGAVYVFGASHLTPPIPWIERWDGSAFVPMIAPPFVPISLGSFDDGSGPVLHAATAVGVYRLVGASWISIGAFSPAPGPSFVRLAEFDAPSGRQLVVSGPFTSIGGVAANRIATWDGSTWQPLGSGLSGAPQGFPEAAVFRLCAVTEESGSALYCGGTFTTAGGVAANGLARWDGTTWTTFGTGLPATPGVVIGLESFDAGQGAGPRLVVHGYTATSPFPPFLVERVGSGWSALPSTPVGTPLANGPIATLRFAGESRESLVVTLASGQVARPTVGRLDACDLTGELFCFGDGVEAACPCGNASSTTERAGCRNSTGAGGALRARGEPSLTADTLALEGSGMPDSSALYFQAGSRHTPTAFGDGLSCTGGPFVRLKTLTNVLGTSTYPDAGSAAISVRGAVGTPGTRHYQARYRNAAAFCTPATFNYTSAVTIVWQS